MKDHTMEATSRCRFRAERMVPLSVTWQKSSGLAQRIADSPHGCPEVEDKRVQDSYSQPYSEVLSLFVRRIDGCRPGVAKASGSASRATLPASRCRLEQLSGSSNDRCAIRSFRPMIQYNVGMGFAIGSSLARVRLFFVLA